MNTIQKWVVNAVAVLVLFGLGGCASMSPQSKSTAIAVSTEEDADLPDYISVFDVVDDVAVTSISGHEASK